MVQSRTYKDIKVNRKKQDITVYRYNARSTGYNNRQMVAIAKRKITRGKTIGDTAQSKYGMVVYRQHSTTFTSLLPTLK